MSKRTTIKLSLSIHDAKAFNKENKSTTNDRKKVRYTHIYAYCTSDFYCLKVRYLGACYISTKVTN